MDRYSQKLAASMRSLYRLKELNSLGSPPILIENEKRILMRYLLNLDADDILVIALNFNEYADEQKTLNAVQDELLADSFSKYINSLN